MTTRMNGLSLILLIIVVPMLSGCASDVVVMNPRTGETTVCGASLRGLNPWSQQQACIGEHIAGGWTRLE
jgi:uncharacterized protein YceK